MAKKYYGFENSGKVWTNWDECFKETCGVPGTAKGFKTREEAEEYSKIITVEILKEGLNNLVAPLDRSILIENQIKAIDTIQEWFVNLNKNYFVLAGYAGTGKSFLIPYIVESLGLNISQVGFCTFTGKASLVVTRKAKGKYECSTLHSVLYDVQTLTTGEVVYIKKHKSDFVGIKLFIIDEASTVNAELLDDLMELGIPVLFIGDHGQLKPVGEVSWIYNKLKNDPDFVLTDILRQAADNPIIKFATMARLGQEIPYGIYDHVAVIDIEDIPKYYKSLLNADQVLCGKNTTRHMYNKKIRQLKGITSPTPVEGDKLICLRNNKKKTIGKYSLVNGMVGFATNLQTRGDLIDFTFTPDFVDKNIKLTAIQKEILGENIDFQERRNYEDNTDSFNYGYAITTYKAQGSQWPNVFIINEPYMSCEANEFGYNPEWLYTAITRAEENVIIAISRKNKKKSYSSYNLKVKSGDDSL